MLTVPSETMGLSMKNSLPFAVPASILTDECSSASLPIGPVSAADAAHLFTEYYDSAADYFSDGRFVRRIVSIDEARVSGLRFAFTGERCPQCGAYSVRKMRGGRRGSECTQCLKLREQRRRARRANEGFK